MLEAWVLDILMIQTELTLLNFSRVWNQLNSTHGQHILLMQSGNGEDPNFYAQLLSSTEEVESHKLDYAIWIYMHALGDNTCIVSFKVNGLGNLGHGDMKAPFPSTFSRWHWHWTTWPIVLQQAETTVKENPKTPSSQQQEKRKMFLKYFQDDGESDLHHHYVLDINHQLEVFWLFQAQ